MSASYDKKPSEKILEMFQLFPPAPDFWGTRAVTTEFKVINALNGSVVFTQFALEPAVDRPSQGIAMFPDDFRSGVINADGRVMDPTDLFRCRLIMMHYHGGWYITVVDDVRGLRPTPNPADWARRIAQIEDPRFREDMTVALANLSLGKTLLGNHYDYLDMAHQCHSQYRIDLHGKSVRHA